MGCDVHIAIEVRREGRWRTWGGPLIPRFKGDPAYALGDEGDRPSDEKWVDELLEARVYTVFALFGVRTERYTPHPQFGWRGFPPDMDPRSHSYVSHEHSETWVTLRELLSIDWAKVKYSEKFVAGLQRLRGLSEFPEDVRLVLDFDS